ncbi:erythromycin esterase family protein, partial [candidate division KSB1 bacterium]|nr:erythromycin esterase family protein [candidate division KSB1 bacterium]NIR69214.1 erythromycin esterase family protein [candidate division KSB1 bacterium]NIS22673.1 erythromycin esterase family protein [candidate division KSB1 bacterium]NIT69529.1 erythromycin esterase family protein [candidate division KSB1 bacterium]NIU23184.1 erythromycin esterase family protein [candidate division KSB1 bacterium]
TTRELEERLKEETAKLTDDVKEKDDRLKIVYEDNRQQQKEIKRLKEEVIKASLQERPLDPIPEWWQRYVQVMSELDEMIRLLAENPPDLDQEANKARCRYVALNLDRQLFRANQYLKGMPIDATEFLEKRDEKLAEIKKKFDWSQILNENGEYVEFEEDEN